MLPAEGGLYNRRLGPAGSHAKFLVMADKIYQFHAVFWFAAQLQQAAAQVAFTAEGAAKKALSPETTPKPGIVDGGKETFFHQVGNERQVAARAAEDQVDLLLGDTGSQQAEGVGTDQVSQARCYEFTGLRVHGGGKGPGVGRVAAVAGGVFGGAVLRFFELEFGDASWTEGTDPKEPGFRFFSPGRCGHSSNNPCSRKTARRAFARLAGRTFPPTVVEI